MRSSAPHDPVPEITVTEAHRRALQGEVLLVDVRETFEVAEIRVDGSLNAPLGELAQRRAELDRGRPVAVICRSGNRSEVAVQHLRAAGVDAINVAGGLIAWHGAGLPLSTGRQGVA